MKSLKIVLAVILISAIGGGLWAYWRHSTLYPSTQDAYVQANVLTIAAEVTGKIAKVHVSENQRITAGSPLFELDNSIYTDLVTEAQAQVDSARSAQAGYEEQASAALGAVESAVAADEAARKQLARIEGLFRTKTAAQAALDQARTAAAQASAAVKSAKAFEVQARSAIIANRDALIAAEAQLRTARTNLERTTVVAPVDGWIANLRLRKGSVVTAYAPLFSIIDASEWWIDANFKETDLPRIKDGQSATAAVDLLPSLTLTGKVQSIGRGSGATFALLPPENATGNWVKVTQRFVVRIELDPTDAPLRVGASTTVTIDTTSPAN